MIFTPPFLGSLPPHPAETFYILTEDGDVLDAESADKLRQE